MKNFKNMVAAFLMVAVMSVGSAFAADGDGIIIGSRDGLLISDRAEGNTKAGNPCTSSTKTNSGIIIGSAVGIIIGSFTGIIIGSAVDAGTPTTNCGIIIGS